jgi:hypothetical protein
MVVWNAHSGNLVHAIIKGQTCHADAMMCNESGCHRRTYKCTSPCMPIADAFMSERMGLPFSDIAPMPQGLRMDGGRQTRAISSAKCSALAREGNKKVLPKSLPHATYFICRREYRLIKPYRCDAGCMAKRVQCP